jgi:hypothetical protein
MALVVLGEAAYEWVGACLPFGGGLTRNLFTQLCRPAKCERGHSVSWLSASAFFKLPPRRRRFRSHRQSTMDRLFGKAKPAAPKPTLSDASACARKQAPFPALGAFP